MTPQIFGLEHFLYILITSIIFVLLIVLMKLVLKKHPDSKTIIFRVIGLIGLLLIIWSRYCITFILGNSLWRLIPDSICGMCSFIVAISLLFFKEDNKLLHIVWLVSIIGDLATLIYPDFIVQDTSFFYPPTISGLLHHSWTLFSIICIFIFNYIHLDIKKAWYQVFGFVIVVGLGYFLIYVAKLEDAFNLAKPLLSGTALYFWVLLPIYLAIYFAVMIFYTLVIKKKIDNKNKKVV